MFTETIIGAIRDLERSKNDAYGERNMLVAHLSKGYPSHLCRHEESDMDREDDWRNIVCVHSPKGQLTWHLHDSEMPLFDHLDIDKNHWDGHDTAEK